MRERIEWQNMWWEDANIEDKQRIALLGDSVTRQLRSKLNEQLEGNYAVDLFASSSQITDLLLYKEIEFFFKSNDWKYELILIHLGGQHGFDKSTVDIDYRKQFKQKYVQIVEMAKNYGHEILFLSFTPNVEKDNLEKANETRNFEIVSRNGVLKECAELIGATYIDLYDYVQQNRLVHTDYIHFNEESNRLISLYIKENLIKLGYARN